jgi:hypothetical protein
LLSEEPQQAGTDDEKDEILAKAAKRVLTGTERAWALVLTAKEKLAGDELPEALRKAAVIPPPTKERIDEMLSKAVEKALSDIIERDYHGIIKHKAKEIIDLGLAVYGGGSEVKAGFGPQSSAASNG